MIKGLEHPSCWERLIDFGLFSLDERKLREDLVNVCKYMQEECKDGGARTRTHFCETKHLHLFLLL